MNSTKRRRLVEEVVESALALKGNERAAHLDSACGSDTELRREVESLLAYEDPANEFLETPALEAAARGLAARERGLPTGRTVGPYRIDSFLGAGGMGEVYRGWDTRLRRTVALKFLSEEYLRDAAVMERFQREARAASALNHPNICTIYDIGNLDGRPFIAMEYLEGQTLRSRLGGTALPVRKAVDYAVQIAHGLAAAHQKGIVHRDMKPDNLWVTPDERIKILDFGLAKLSGPVDELTDTTFETEPGKVMGTVGYMSPEQLRGQPTDQRTDIFAFGAILYEMLAGRRAFQGPSPVDTMSAILNADPARLPDAELDRLTLHCLKKDPEHRPHAADLASELETLLETRKIRAAFKDSSASARHWLWVALLAASAIALIGAGVWAGRFRRSPTLPIRSLAVLPLQNISADPAHYYLADGIADQLTTDLAKIGSLRVIARTSTVQYAGHRKHLSQIAQELQVDALIEGTVAQSGNKIRVTAQLIDGRSESHLWAQSYERDHGDILDLEDSIALDIASHVNAALTPSERGTLTKHHSVTPEAYEAYVRGRTEIGKQTEQGLRNAIQDFQNAIEADPLFAAGYAGLSDAFSLMVNYGVLKGKDAFPRAEAAARKAMELDPSSGEAHAAFAFVRLHYDWDWSGAETEYRRALQLSPGFAIAHLRYAEYLWCRARHSEAWREIERARESDRLSITIDNNVGRAFYYARRYDDTIREMRSVLALHPERIFARIFLAMAYAQRRMYAESIAESQRVSRLLHIGAGVDEAYANAAWGRKDAALRILRDYVEKPTESGTLDYVFIAGVYTAMGDKDRAFAWLDQAYENRDFFLPYMNVDPQFDPIRSDPRFVRLLDRLGFPR